MLGFIRTMISALKWRVKTAATYLLKSAVKKDHRWAIQPLIWLGADCNAIYKTYHNSQNNTDYHETTLSYAIKNNKQLALWLLDIPAIQEQIKKDADKQPFLTVAKCIVNASDDNLENLQIEAKLLTIQPIDAKLIANTLKQYVIYGYKTIEHMIDLASSYNELQQDQNLVLRTAIDLELQDIAQKTLDNKYVRMQLRADMQPYGDLSADTVNAYLEDSKLLCEFINKSWVFNMFVQNINKARVVPAPRPELTKEEQISKNHEDSIAREANMFAAYKMQLEKDKAKKKDDIKPKSRLSCTIF